MKYVESGNCIYLFKAERAIVFTGMVGGHLSANIDTYV